MDALYDFEDIDDYVQNRMSESDRLAFEMALADNPDLQQRVEARRAEDAVLGLLYEQHWLSQLDAWRSEGETEKKIAPPSAVKPLSGGRKWMWPLAAAASIALLITAGNVFDWFGKPTNPSNIAGQNQSEDTTRTQLPSLGQREDTSTKNNEATPPTLTPQEKDLYARLAQKSYRKGDFDGHLMGGQEDTTVQDRYKQALIHYRAERYQDALQLLQQLDDARRDEFLFLRGYVLYDAGLYAKAERDFRALRKFPDSDRHIDARWCEVFCMVRQLPGARQRLDAELREMTADPDGAYFQQATALRDSLPR